MHSPPAIIESQKNSIKRQHFTHDHLLPRFLKAEILVILVGGQGKNEQRSWFTSANTEKKNFQRNWDIPRSQYGKSNITNYFKVLMLKLNA